MPGKEIIFEQHDAIATITFNRPEVHNAFNVPMMEHLEKAVDTIDNDASIRAVILTGAGEKSFVSGSDIKELSERNTLNGIESSLRRQALLNRIEGLSVPTFAAINGYAFGMGCEIAMAATFRVASNTAKLGQLEINLGIIPGAGGTQRLSRLVGKAKAAELILFGKVIAAEYALSIGLLHHVVAQDKLMEECRQWAKTICEKSSVAVKYALRALNQGFEVDLATGLKIEGLCVGACYSSEDSKEGLNAFLEKREAKYKGC